MNPRGPKSYFRAQLAKSVQRTAIGDFIQRIAHRRTIKKVLYLLVCIGILVPLFGHGFDLTDEGYYLNSVEYPEFSTSFSTWPVAAIPVWIVSFGHVAIYRSLNVALTFLLGFLLARAILKSHLGITAPILASLVGLSALIGLRVWLPTPNYNWLNLQGLMLLWLAILSPRDRVRGALSVIGFFVVLAAKPTTAVFGVVLFVAALFVSHIKRKFLEGVIIGFLPILLAHTIAGVSPLTYVTEFEFIRESAGLVGNTRDLLRFDLSTWNTQIRSNIGVVTFSIAVGALLVLTSAARKCKFGSTLYLGVALLAASFVTLSPSVSALSATSLCLAVIVVSQLFGKWITQPRKPLGIAEKIRGRGWLIPIGLSVTPYAYAVGTNTDYYYKMQDALVFVILAAVFVLSQYGVKPWSLGTLSVVLAVSSIGYGLGYPYRQNTPLLQQDHSLDVSRGDNLKVSGQTAEFVTRVSALLGAGGFEKGDPVIDLSGRNPGVVWFLGARPVGGAWVIGGYSGSSELLKLRLKRANCEILTGSWVLREDGIYSAISIAEVFGSEANFRRFFYQVGNTPSIPVNGVVQTSTKLSVWSPKFNVADPRTLPCKSQD